MNGRITSIFMALGSGLLCASIAIADQVPSPAPDASLGQVARNLKTQKAKESKPAKVFDNDNLGTNSDWTTASAKEASPKAPESDGSSTATHAHNEQYYRAQMETLKSHLETNQRELDVLQQKLGQNQMQYYADPNKSLQQQYSREDVGKLTDQIDAKKADVDSDKKAIEDLRDQLRHEGGDSGWLR